MAGMLTSRRQSLQVLSLLGLGAAAGRIWHPSVAVAQTPPAGDIKDEDISQFALNLEYMEAEYYLRATTGKGIDAADVGASPGDVKGGRKVSFQSKAVREFGEELADNELAHVRYYRKTLGSQAVARPAIDFEAGFLQSRSPPGFPILTRSRTA
jgi:hypothetical protein